MKIYLYSMNTRLVAVITDLEKVNGLSFYNRLSGLSPCLLTFANELFANALPSTIYWWTQFPITWHFRHVSELGCTYFVIVCACILMHSARICGYYWIPTRKRLTSPRKMKKKAWGCARDHPSFLADNWEMVSDLDTETWLFSVRLSKTKNS